MDKTVTEKGPRWLEYMALDEVLPALKNPKGHDEGVIAGSIGAFGYIEPIVLDERTGRLVAGHGRTADLRRRHAAGETPPDGITLGEGGTWLVPVTRGWASHSDDQAHAAGIAINEGTMAGGWNQGDLAALLTELQAAPSGLDGTGWDDNRLDDLLAQLGDEVVLDAQATDAAHAEQTERGEPATPREVQGLREVGLMFSTPDHREYTELLARLRNTWQEDVPAQVVLRAMRLAVQAEDGKR